MRARFFAFGVLLSVVFGVLWGEDLRFSGFRVAWLLTLLFPFGIVLFSPPDFSRRRRLQSAGIFLAVLCAIALYSDLFFTIRAPFWGKPFGSRLEGAWRGRVEAVATRPDGRLAVTLRPLSSELPSRLRLSADASLGPIPVGCVLFFSARVGLPPQSQNIGVSDTRRGFARSGIALSGRLLAWRADEAAEPCLFDSGGWGMRGLIRHLERGLRPLPEGEGKGLYYAILLGRTDELSPAAKAYWQKSGLYHLLVVSGLHIALLFALFYKLGWGFSGLASASWRRFVRQDFAAVFGLAGIVTAMLFYPPGASVNRAVATALLYSAYRILRIRAPVDWVLMGLAVGFLLFDPAQLFELSFVMSFVCVFALALLAPRADALLERVFPWRPLRLLIAANLAVSLALLPILSRLQGLLSFGGIFLNLLLVPLFSLLLPGVFMGSLIGLLDRDIFLWIHNALDILSKVSVFIYQGLSLELSLPYFSPFGAGLFWALLVGLGWASRRKGWGLRIGFVSLVLPFLGLWLSQDWGETGRLRVTLLDVGQGESILIETPDRRHYLLDGGGWAGSSADVGGRVVVPALRARGVKRLEALILSHPDPDHALGFSAVLDRLPVKALWWNGEAGGTPGFFALLQSAAKKGIATERLYAGTPPLALGGGAALSVLHPHTVSLPNPRLRQTNDHSLVLRLAYGERRFLLTGDIEAVGESTLLHGPFREQLAAGVLKVPHHGSRTSSSAEFLKRVSPRIAVGSMGEGNFFGHPHSEVVARYRALGIPFHRTDEEGAVTIETDGKAIAVFH